MNVLENPKSFKQVRGFFLNPIRANWMVDQIAERVDSTPDLPTRFLHNQSIVYASPESVGGTASALVTGLDRLLDIELDQRDQAFYKALG